MAAERSGSSVMTEMAEASERSGASALLGVMGMSDMTGWAEATGRMAASKDHAKMGRARQIKIDLFIALLLRWIYAHLVL
jgi:hypothetical protein